jgi:hypothetical protein
MMPVAISAAMPKNIITLISPSMSSPMSLAKPITCTLILGGALFAVASTAFRELVLVADLLFEHPRQAVVVDALAGARSLSSSGTKIIEDFMLLATRLPRIPERATFCFSCSTLLAEPSKPGGITGPPRKPSSVTSVQRTPGIHNDFTHARSTPGVTASSSLTCFNASRYAGSKNGAVGVLDHHAQRVAEAAQVVLVREVVLDVRLALRNHLLEARVQHELRRGEEAEHDGDDRANDQHQHPVVEHQALEAVAGILVEVREIADDRHLIEDRRIRQPLLSSQCFLFCVCGTCRSP